MTGPRTIDADMSRAALDLIADYEGRPPAADAPPVVHIGRGDAVRIVHLLARTAREDIPQSLKAGLVVAGRGLVDALRKAAP